ncbi:hypothetical protein D3C80_1841380 [compost metagenome]
MILTTGKNRLGITRKHRFDADLWRRQTHVGKDIPRAADRKRIADDLPSTHGVEGLVPDLIKHPQRFGALIALA